MCSENKGADQLLCFCICKSQFSHDEAHIVKLGLRRVYNILLIIKIVRTSEKN